MEWKSEYETGVAEIDHQHQSMIELVTEFEAAVKSNAHRSSLHALMTRAKELAEFHFAVEESLMQVLEYPRLSAHRSEHRFVLERIADFDALALNSNIKDDMAPGLRTWLLGHFLDSDRQLIAFTRKAAPMPESAAAPFDETPIRLGSEALDQALHRALVL